MLAEIFLIRLEAILRASKEESVPADNSRFVPITLADKETFKDCLQRHAFHDASARGAGRAKVA